MTPDQFAADPYGGMPEPDELMDAGRPKTREQRLENALAFFGSCIRSGEAWDDICQRAYDDATRPDAPPRISNAVGVESQAPSCILRAGCDAPNLCRSQERCCARDSTRRVESQAQDTMEDFGDAAALVDRLGQCKTKGDMLSEVLVYRKRLLAESQAQGAVPPTWPECPEFHRLMQVYRAVYREKDIEPAYQAVLGFIRAGFTLTDDGWTPCAMQAAAQQDQLASTRGRPGVTPRSGNGPSQEGAPRTDATHPEVAPEPSPEPRHLTRDEQTMLTTALHESARVVHRAPVAPEPSPVADLVRDLKDDISSGEVGPNILCRQVEKIASALAAQQAAYVSARHLNGTLIDKLDAAESALEALTAELAEWQTLGGTKLYERWQSELLRAERAEAALEAQRGRLAELDQLRRDQVSSMRATEQNLERERDAARTELRAARELAEQYRVDAERYKWLRMCMAGEWDKLNGVRLDKSVIALDAAIDARRALGADQP